MTTRDSYVYSVQFDANGIGDVQQATAAVDKLGRAAKQSARDVTGAGRSIASAGQRIGQGLTQVTYIFDDMAYGARSLRNQILPLSTSLLGFGPAGAIVGAAGTVIVGAFAKQIDAALAWAGVLDENVVKGMNKGKESADDLAESVGRLDAKMGPLEKSLDRQAIAANRWADALAGVSDRIDFREIDASLDDLARAFVPAQDAGDALRAELAAVDAEVDRLGKAFGEQAKLQLPAYQKRAEQLRAELDKLADSHESRVKEAMDGFRDALQAGGDQARDVVDRLAKLRGENDRLVRSLRDAIDGTKALKDEQRDFADAILGHEKAIQQAQNERFAEAEKHRQEEVDGILDLMKLEQKREEERNRRIVDRAQERGRAALDEKARRVVEAFGPQLQGRINEDLRSGIAMGASPQQAEEATTFRLARFLERMGAGDAAGAAAGQLVDEQARQFQAIVDANNARSMLDREMLGGMTTILNLYEQQRAEAIATMRAMETIRRRAINHGRAMRPLRMLMGNPVNGRF